MSEFQKPFSEKARENFDNIFDPTLGKFIDNFVNQEYGTKENEIHKTDLVS